ncbi:MAG TPA: hypothetical protein VM537_18405 [Anaerolineae bacterium]|nr:hypothetical protein [Anaerolineae bacterium]
MIMLNDLMAFLNGCMGDVGDKDPYMPNGLQVRGREEVKLLGTGVSASQRLFEEAVARGPARALARYVDRSAIPAARR